MSVRLLAIMAAAVVAAPLQGVRAEERRAEQPETLTPTALRNPTSPRLSAEHVEILQPVKQPQGEEISPPEETRVKTANEDTHTISSTDFAEKTASVNAKVLQDQKAQADASLVEDALTLGTKPKEKEAEEGIGLEGKDTNNVESGSMVKEKAPDAESSLVNEEPSQTESKLPETKSENDSKDNEDKEYGNMSEQKNEDSYKSMTLNEFANQVSEELKVSSNDAIIAWSQKNLKVSWTGDAANALKAYNDAITISQAANNTECVKRDLESYKNRMKTLEDVIKSCESGLKRDALKELQEKTKDLVNKVNDIVQEANSAIGKLSTDSPEFEKEKNDLENAAKEKLKELDVESMKEDLSKLKEKALQTDEEEYEKCIEGKPEKSIIVDTLNDIMRIKNNCVG